MDALGAVMETLRRRKEQPVEAPKLVSLGSFTLLFVAIDVVLVMYVLDGLLPPWVGSTLSKVLPAIFGVAAVAYLEQVRVLLFRLSQRWRVRLVVFALPLLWVPLAVPYEVVFVTPTTATIDLEDATETKRSEDADTIVTARVTGFRARRLIVKGQFADTLRLGRNQMLTSAISSFFGVAVFGDPLIQAPPTVLTHVQIGMKAGELIVQGELPPRYVAVVGRQPDVRTSPRGALTRIILTPASRNVSSVRLRLPKGSYDFAMRRPGAACVRLLKDVLVQTDTIVMLEPAPCVPPSATVQ